MKTVLLTGLLLAITLIPGFAQVKIGDNPNNINSNSILEMESDNKGLLGPRLTLTDINSIAPLSGTVPAGMLVYNTGGLLPDGFYFWNGSKWLAIQSSANTRDNYVLVKTATDLPAPVDGIITLKAGTAYEINGTIILTNKINLNGCLIIGMDAYNDRLIYASSSGELFTGNKGGIIRTLTLVANNAGSKLFNLDMAITENLIVRDAFITNCKEVGLVKGGKLVFFNVISYIGNTNGIQFQDNSHLLVFNTGWFSSNTGTFEKFSGSFGHIEKIGGFYEVLASNTGLDITGITSISDAAILANTAFLGAGIRVNGSFPKIWEVEGAGIDTEKDEVATGNIYLTTPVTTNFAATNTPSKILGSTASAELFRVEAIGNNRLVYKGTKSREFSVLASLSLTSQAANKYFSFYVFKNGILIPESEQSMRLSTGVDKGSITLSCTVLLNPDDYIEIWAANTSDASGMTVETFNLSVQ